MDAIIPLLHFILSVLIFLAVTLSILLTQYLWFKKIKSIKCKTQDIELQPPSYNNLPDQYGFIEVKLNN